MKQQEAHVICIKWGHTYSANDVNRLYKMTAKQTKKFQLVFHCFTDDTNGLEPNIVTHSLPNVAVPKEELKYVYQKEVGLCDDDLGGLSGKRVLFFDIDVIIVDNIDCFFEFSQADDFVIINDWNSRGDAVGQASCYSWEVGTLGYVKRNFEKNYREIIDQYFTASQEYLSEQVINRFGRLVFWPDSWCKSFKQHCLPPWYLRYFFPPSIPEGTKMLAFHGHPKIDNAVKGIWSESMPFYKKLYKKNLPMPSLTKYWQ